MISKLVSKFDDVDDLVSEGEIPGVGRPDIIFRTGQTINIVESKYPVPQTRHRLDAVIQQLNTFRDGAMEMAGPGANVKLILAIPGELSPEATARLARHGISLWDRRWITHHMIKFGIPDRGMFRETRMEDQSSTMGKVLSGLLRSTPAGRPSWSSYQSISQDILEYLFEPHLIPAIREKSNLTKTNRRDMIFPNYAEEGFWKFVRKEYRADFVVVDAKNYVKLVGKTQVLQIANYLQHHGPGLFAMIVCRKGVDRSGLYTMREQWVLHNKMVVVLDDEDVLQMITSKESGGQPTDVIRQKIEDFRLDL